MKFFKLLLPALMTTAVCSQAFAAKPVIIKFASLTPEGTTWVKSMDGYTREVSEKTEGRVGFRTYWGGKMGDEKDVVRKIRNNQLQAGGFTGVGIGEIAPEIRILDTPALFKNTGEIDYVYKAMDADFKAVFEKKGFVLLGWSEVGSVNIFSESPVTKLEDLKNIKMWTWEGDPVAEETFESLGIKPISLSITDVMTSLQTGMVNGVYASPLSVMAMQWDGKMKYMFGQPLTYSFGAVLISRKAFDKIPPEDQKIMLDLGEKYFTDLNSKVRKDNEESVKLLAKKLTVTKPAGKEVVTALEKAGNTARMELIGKLYPQEFLDKLNKTLSDFRAKKVK